MPKILNSAIRIKDKVFEGADHAEAIQSAQMKGYDVSKIDRERDGLFKVSDGRLITRQQALEEFGITHSEEVSDQKNASTKPIKFLCHDTGQFLEQCIALSKGGNKVKYYTPYEFAFPKYEHFVIGQGFKEIENEMSFWKWVDWADCIVNMDVYGNDVIHYLRKHGKVCFGSGLGERLEEDRWGLKKILKAVDLPVHHADKIRGVTDLREYLKTNKDKYCKINVFRGEVESFYAKDYDSVELLIDELAETFGPFKDDIDFIVEDKIDTEIEVGCDLFFNGKDYIKPYLYGYEFSKSAYVGVFSDKLPPILNETMEKLKPVLRELDWRGAISTEERVIDRKRHYVIDICARFGSPFTNLYTEIIKNFPEVIYKVAKGEDVKIDNAFKYVGAVPFDAPHSREHWVKIDLDPKDRKEVKLNMATEKDGKYYATKGRNEHNMTIATAIAGANNIDELITKLENSSKKVAAYTILKDTIGELNTIKEKIRLGKNMGIDF